MKKEKENRDPLTLVRPIRVEKEKKATWDRSGHGLPLAEKENNATIDRS